MNKTGTFYWLLSIVLLIFSSPVISQNCSISDVFAETDTCDSNGQFLVAIEFNYTNTGSMGFEIRGNGVTYDTFDYGQTFYTIGPLDGDCRTLYEFVIIDIENPNCSSFTEFNEPICCNDECSINDLYAEVYDCDTTGVYYVDFEFNISNPMSDGFIAQGNGTTFGEFEYGETFYTIGPFDSCGEINELIIIDNENRNCNAAIGVPLPDCCSDSLCSISNLYAELTPCDTNGIYYVAFEFDIDNPASSGFIARGNGTVFGEFVYSETFYTIGPFDSCNEINELVIIDKEDRTCTANIEVPLADCCSDEECLIYDLEVLRTEIVDDENLVLTFDFEHLATDSFGFDIFINGQFQSFSNYMDDTYTIRITDIELQDSIVLKICENDNPECCSSVAFGLSNEYNCEFEDLVVLQTECIDDFYYYVIDFYYPVDLSRTEFVLRGNGNFYGTYLFQDLPVAIGPFNLSDNINELDIRLLDDLECNIGVELNPSCGLLSNQKEILEDNISVISNGGQIKISSEITIESDCYVFDLFGRLMHKSSFSNDLTIDSQSYDSGIYVVHIENGLGEYTTKVYVAN